jgi:hypothetical protein
MFKGFISKLKEHVVGQQPDPVPGVKYHHKDRDPLDMIAFVVPQWVEEGMVQYAKFYKDPATRARVEECSVAEFNQWFREGE